MCELEISILDDAAIVEIDFELCYDDYGPYAEGAYPTYLDGKKLTDQQAESIYWLAGPRWIETAAASAAYEADYYARH